MDSKISVSESLSTEPVHEKSVPIVFALAQRKRMYLVLFLILIITFSQKYDFLVLVSST